MVTKKKPTRPTAASRKTASKSTKTPKKSPETTASPASTLTYDRLTTSDAPRRVRPPKRRLWRRQDKRFKDRPKLPNVWKLTRLSATLLWENWKLIGGLVAIYGFLTILLVRGLNGGTDISTLNQELNTLAHGTLGHLAAGVSIFALLLSSSNSASSDAAGAYQSFLLLIVSLAIIWALRQRLSGTKVRVRDAFYNGMYPLIPLICVLLIVGLQFLPLLIGAASYSALIQNGIAITVIEKGFALALMVLGACLSVYLLCSSIFALYIVTLPNMTPLKALRSARELVRYRRWSVIRKVLFLPVVLLLVGSLIMLPFILTVPVAAQWVFFLLSMSTLAAVHAYLYTLYRELLHE